MRKIRWKDNVIKKEELDDPSNIVISVDNERWNSDRVITVKDLARAIKEIKEEDAPKPPPGTELHSAYIAFDENYLYVWVRDRWKRAILSNW